MPTKSYYAGFNAPNDPVKWNAAIKHAKSGEQILIKNMLKTIKNPYEFHQVSLTT
jgi:hypothetical protein